MVYFIILLANALLWSLNSQNEKLPDNSDTRFFTNDVEQLSYINRNVVSVHKPVLRAIWAPGVKNTEWTPFHCIIRIEIFSGAIMSP